VNKPTKLISLIFIILITACQSDKVKMERVKHAQLLKAEKIKDKFDAQSVDESHFEMYLSIYKLEQMVEVWVRDVNSSSTFKMVSQYPFCKFSGKLGPKRKENDYQIPEGLYYINRFNPKSKFHLSLGLNYPNESDKILGDKFPGYDIFIHGGCNTVGCVPITDTEIKELYVIADRARSYGQNDIPVYMFPFKMTDENFSEYSEKFPEHSEFWSKLKKAYDKLDNVHTFLQYIVDEKGAYKIL